MNDLDSLRDAVDEMNTKFPRPGVGPLSLSKPYDVRQDWQDIYPDAGKPGVYALFDHDWHLLKIGKSSKSNDLGRRLGSYFNHDGQGSRRVRETNSVALDCRAALHRNYQSPT